MPTDQDKDVTEGGDITSVEVEDGYAEGDGLEEADPTALGADETSDDDADSEETSAGSDEHEDDVDDDGSDRPNLETGVLVVTGTDTGVGKTIVTAALAARARAAGHTVAVVKPAQTGTAAFAEGETADMVTVAHLVGEGVDTETVVEYPDPLSPLAAAEVAGQPELVMSDVVDRVEALAETHDLVLVEGAGGLLVPMGVKGWNIADLALELWAPAIVVTRAGLGTINHTALTLEALKSRNIVARVVIGAWPAHPELVHERNQHDLPGEIVGVVPENAGALSPEEFQAQAPGWFADRL